MRQGAPSRAICQTHVDPTWKEEVADWMSRVEFLMQKECMEHALLRIIHADRASAQQEGAIPSSHVFFSERDVCASQWRCFAERQVWSA